jgi:hypothetical protein
MVKVLEQAIAELARLPEADQEQIGRSLLSLVDKIRRVRAELDKGIKSLEAGGSKALDLEDLLRRLNEGQGRS